jgi:hypothetical protein
LAFLRFGHGKKAVLLREKLNLHGSQPNLPVRPQVGSHTGKHWIQILTECGYSSMDSEFESLLDWLATDYSERVHAKKKL